MFLRNIRTLYVSNVVVIVVVIVVGSAIVIVIVVVVGSAIVIVIVDIIVIVGIGTTAATATATPVIIPIEVLWVQAVQKALRVLLRQRFVPVPRSAIGQVELHQGLRVVVPRYVVPAVIFGGAVPGVGIAASVAGAIGILPVVSLAGFHRQRPIDRRLEGHRAGIVPVEFQLDDPVVKGVPELAKGFLVHPAVFPVAETLGHRLLLLLLLLLLFQTVVEVVAAPQTGTRRCTRSGHLLLLLVVGFVA
mmetsp:Transcript_3129/g.6326  ORF Transcript_3129/g.6326 Transcript_3129/m.6326 type:complete len:247 (-) Transcript_3129:213-953(-)